jgi:Putative Zn-dependent protease, contains TPR repeats
MKKALIKRAFTLILAGIMLLTPISSTAAGLTERLLYGAAAVTMVNAYYNDLNEHGQKQMLREYQNKTGVLNDEQKQQYIEEMINRLRSTKLIKGNYASYVNPSKEINAFCAIGRVVSVNKGIIDALDEDELAVVLGHELGHGELKHSVVGTTKSISLGLIVDLYMQSNPNNTSYYLSGIAANMINNEVFTLNQEIEADTKGFEFATAAGYNPGAGAAENIKVRSLYGEMWREGLAKVINPNNHPKATNRVNAFAKQMTIYSGNHITVRNEKMVQIDGQDIFAPVSAFNHLAGERAYLIAGNLARVYHDNALDTAYVSDDGAVYIGSQKIVTPADNDMSADEIVTKINAATGR